jgi:hypothetical protein
MIGWNSNLGDAMIKSGNVAPVGVGRKEMISTFPDLVPAIDQYNRERYTYMSSELTLGDDFDMGEGSDFNKLQIDDDFMVVIYSFPESEVIGEAFYGAVLVNKNNNTARYHTLEAGPDESGHFCPRSLSNHQHVADIATRDWSGNLLLTLSLFRDFSSNLPYRHL